jgi:NAD(P)-dependent dehydrogenase (short-subunit alcohol dehydrogenase family)
MAKKLIKEGHEVFSASRNQPSIDGVKFQEVDVTSDFELQIPDSLDGMVYCPGSINLKPFKRMQDEDFLNDFKLNALGATRCIKQALSALQKSEAASIVLFSTVAVQTGLNFHSSVAMAKGALEGLCRALAAEFAPKIRVNCIAPSLTKTPLAEQLLNSEDKIKANSERHPLKRLGSTEDMASAAGFLLSKEASWITGQVLGVDGGLGTIR